MSSEQRVPRQKHRLLVHTEAGEPQPVGEVSLEGDLGGDLKGDLVVTSYTRDPIDFASLVELRVLPVDESVDGRGLRRFRSYLEERKKTAVVRAGGLNLLLIPSRDDALSAFLSPARQTVSSVVTHPRGPVMADRTQLLENSVEERLHVFSTDREFNGPLAFPPMDKALRFIVHDVVEQFSLRTGVGVVSVSEGDDEERHVVVYREGYQPAPSAAELVDKRTIVPVGPAQSSRKAVPAKSEPPKRPQALKLVNQVRDRRTVEEVQLERQRMKRTKKEDS